jgi:hypothetical protein
MESQGIDRPDIYSNTLLLAETVGDYGIQEGLNLLPVQYKSPDKELAKAALEGLVERGLSENQEYLDRLEEELKIKTGRLLRNIEYRGNTAGATIPLLFSEMDVLRRAKSGDYICFSAIGSGWVWGSAILKWE